MISSASWKSILWTLVGTSAIVFLFMHQLTPPVKPIFIEKNEFLFYDLNKEEPLIPDQKCQLPRIHPFDQSILTYLTSPKPIICKERVAALTFVDKDGILRFNFTAVKSSGYVVEKLDCDYKEIIRKNDFEVKYGDAQKISINGSKLFSDFVYVSCYNFAGIPFYTNVHCHIFPKKDRLKPTSDSMYNVLIIGIDSLSRLSFIRHLPKTYKFLIKNLNAFVFRGMTKVGDNTFPNLGAILTGKSVFGNELPKIENPTGTYDEWPCVWKNFSKSGYATLFAEDRPDIGLFNYLRGGFKDQPTDHYMRPFWLAVQTSKLHRLSSNLCFGRIPKHLLQLKYTKDFIKKYSSVKQPFFSFTFFVELSHDYVNQVASADGDLESWLKDLLHSGFLNRTFLFFLSDHGHRFDAMRATLVGRIEERMPFLALVIPKTILSSEKKVVDNLRINQGRLTTPYDIYFTVIDILKLSKSDLSFGSETIAVGTSLFRFISPNRTCSSAGIPDHYCVCETERQLTVSDPRSQKAANTLVASINEQLRSQTNFCSELTLIEILRADLIVPRREVVVNSRLYFGKQIEDGAAAGMITKLRVIVRTAPGLALFEGTLLSRDDDEHMSVLGDISRINLYGTQSSCIQDPILKKYCYCVNANG
ncbi:uncharacterized protein TNIN_290791 [Trichonephila inaurata madagascariensis]|uniref:Uncharacterized protein n=1 Tax=Trichonephila inaurata madagascariensis TaxID=2747483 RepID=A0A8X7C0F3_9ARAC|nr:uncharacterized protein TNIN_290791 [Trichonephila inaurata madagascariensis]